MKKVIIVGCGLTGSVIARELAEAGYYVHILERRNHIGGNMYDYVDTFGVLIHKYGPHTFHTKKKYLYEYICKFGEWIEFKLTCGAEINGICTPTPFNFQTIDDFFPCDYAEKLKDEIKKSFPDNDTISVVEALQSSNEYVRKYAQFLFDNDYSLYTAKQWGCSPAEIDPSILKRVPLRLNYENGYFDDEYQVMPKTSYTAFFEKLLDHKNIQIDFQMDALDSIEVKDNKVVFNGETLDHPLVYTGPIDELFNHIYGELPYRSLLFELVHENIHSKQNMPVVAYPQHKDIIRIIEYTKLPVQNVHGTTYEKEYSIPYKPGEKNDPYYPVLTSDSQKLYKKYRALADSIRGLYVCGRLGNFKYYNMDEALDAALNIVKQIINK